MNYQEYKHDFLESLRNDSAISGSETEEEFLNRALVFEGFNDIAEFDVVEAYKMVEVPR